MRYWLLLSWLMLLSGLAMPVHANAAAPICTDSNCVEEQQLHLSAALGFGQRSNPLFGGETLPLIIVPDLYYYGKYLFFDNGKLGSSWQLTPELTLSLAAQLNSEKGYFQKWFAGNAFQFRSTNAGISTPILNDERFGPQQVSVREVNKRPTAVDGGIQLDWFRQSWQLQAAWWHDISNNYNGQNASISASHHWQNPLGNWLLSGKLYWKSARLIDTYYGIDNNEPFYLPRHQGKASWQPELRLSWQYPLSERTAVLAFVRYLHLDDAMTDSPLVQDNNVTTWFLGISYRLL